MENRFFLMQLLQNICIKNNSHKKDGDHFTIKNVFHYIYRFTKSILNHVSKVITYPKTKLVIEITKKRKSKIKIYY